MQKLPFARNVHTFRPRTTFGPRTVIGKIWEYLRGNSALVWDSYDAIVTACKAVLSQIFA
jgi:hypothetical protein